VHAGRAWAVHELRMKSFEELHVLWWQCLKEQNRIVTENITRKILKAGYGRGESTERLKEVSGDSVFKAPTEFRR
jgi:large subunit ribosomal protein L47